MSEYTYKYPRPAYTADTVLMADNGEGQLHVLLVKRGGEPFKGAWALPGGFVNDGERSVEAARRELAEETGVEVPDLDVFTLIGVYDAPGRDPRGWTVSAAYAAQVSRMVDAQGGDDAAEARWFPLNDLPELAFDHAQIIADVLDLLSVAEEE